MAKMKLSLGEDTIEFSTDLEFLHKVNLLIDKHPQGGLLKYEAENGDTFELLVPTRGNGEEVKAREFNRAHGITVF